MNNLISKLIIIFILIICILSLINTYETFEDEAAKSDTLLKTNIQNCEFLPRQGTAESCINDCLRFSNFANTSEFTSCKGADVCNRICAECNEDRFNHCVEDAQESESSNTSETFNTNDNLLDIKNNEITVKRPPQHINLEYKIHITHKYNNFSHIFIPIGENNTLNLNSFIKDKEPYKITVYGFDAETKIKSNTLDYLSL